MKLIHFFSILILSYTQISCGNGSCCKIDESAAANLSLKSEDLVDSVQNLEVTKNINALVAAYLEIKNALVASDSQESINKANDFLKMLIIIDIKKMNKNQQVFFNSIYDKLKKEAERIAQTNDINNQRIFFKDLSDNILLVVKTFNCNKNSLYLQYCPMAFDDKGASWISDKNEIRNPYFGDAMLKCGVVKAEF